MEFNERKNYSAELSANHKENASTSVCNYQLSTNRVHRQQRKNLKILFHFCGKTFETSNKSEKFAIEIDVINNEIHTNTIFDYNSIESKSTATVFSTRANKSPETDRQSCNIFEQQNCPDGTTFR